MVTAVENWCSRSIVCGVQVENLLLGSQGEIKLCDFGSATRESLYPDETWTHNQRTMTEELVCKLYKALDR